MSSATSKFKEYLSSTNALQEQASVEVIPSGEEWEIIRWWGSANPSKDTHVSIVWDYDGANEEIICLTHTSEKREVLKTFVGDGSKKIAIVLVNDSLDSEKLAAGFEYRVL